MRQGASPLRSHLGGAAAPAVHIPVPPSDPHIVDMHDDLTWDGLQYKHALRDQLRSRIHSAGHSTIRGLLDSRIEERAKPPEQPKSRGRRLASVDNIVWEVEPGSTLTFALDPAHRPPDFDEDFYMTFALGKKQPDLRSQIAERELAAEAFPLSAGLSNVSKESTVSLRPFRVVTSDPSHIKRLQKYGAWYIPDKSKWKSAFKADARCSSLTGKLPRAERETQLQRMQARSAAFKDLKHSDIAYLYRDSLQSKNNPALVPEWLQALPLKPGMVAHQRSARRPELSFLETTPADNSLHALRRAARTVAMINKLGKHKSGNQLLSAAAKPSVAASGQANIAAAAKLLLQSQQSQPQPSASSAHAPPVPHAPEQPGPNS